MNEYLFIGKTYRFYSLRFVFLLTFTCYLFYFTDTFYNVYLKYIIHEMFIGIYILCQRSIRQCIFSNFSGYKSNMLKKFNYKSQVFYFRYNECFVFLQFGLFNVRRICLLFFIYH